MRQERTPSPSRRASDGGPRAGPPSQLIDRPQLSSSPRSPTLTPQGPPAALRALDGLRKAAVRSLITGVSETMGSGPHVPQACTFRSRLVSGARVVDCTPARAPRSVSGDGASNWSNAKHREMGSRLHSRARLGDGCSDLAFGVRGRVNREENCMLLRANSSGLRRLSGKQGPWIAVASHPRLATANRVLSTSDRNDRGLSICAGGRVEQREPPAALSESRRGRLSRCLGPRRVCDGPVTRRGPGPWATRVQDARVGYAHPASTCEWPQS